MKEVSNPAFLNPIILTQMAFTEVYCIKKYSQGSEK